MTLTKKPQPQGQGLAAPRRHSRLQKSRFHCAYIYGANIYTIAARGQLWREQFIRHCNLAHQICRKVRAYNDLLITSKLNLNLDLQARIHAKRFLYLRTSLLNILTTIHNHSQPFTTTPATPATKASQQLFKTPLIPVESAHLRARVHQRQSAGLHIRKKPHFETSGAKSASFQYGDSISRESAAPQKDGHIWKGCSKTYTGLQFCIDGSQVGDPRSQ